jgi:hypothetical protein
VGSNPIGATFAQIPRKEAKNKTFLNQIFVSFIIKQLLKQSRNCAKMPEIGAATKTEKS